MGSLTQLLQHPLELKSALVLKYYREPLFPGEESKIANSKDLKRCYELLKLTSRSFAAVIQELNPELRDAIMIFYLVLRALDTIEDDMTINPSVKVKLLNEFDEKLDLDDWSFDGNGPNEKDRDVLVDFPYILREYHNLKPEYQKVIKEITRKMGQGMVNYVLDESFNLNGVETIKDYDLYCHYVAGLVGDGLTQLIVLAGFGDENLYEASGDRELYESMGLFLQKTNIIRDYAEDLEDGRSFWPKEIWSLYVEKLPDLQKDKSNGLRCINHLVLNALTHVNDVLTYLASINEQSTFQFCSIPQVMAIATLSLLFNNEKVLVENVKIRKGETCYLILKSRTLKGCVEIFQYYLREIKSKLMVEDPNYLPLNIQIAKIEQFMEEMYQDKLPAGVRPNETEIYLKTQERTKSDEKMAITFKMEENNFLMVVSYFGIAVLAIAYYTLFFNK
ncbi:hypothetical protein Kpol_541p19 [Vanderwaltozyma polyspora DSM 70294]|uniref:Squalene synthase n=1 Tax=Vanderwaltozyma polyspora (strain ATCC 22028 / DSM 70294 / BCRC 21397 / CBS 2163 / NBRC 10782 / NRRL Y-8283 / UCD 57-17) TaxID=436907 RepID=A7TIW4_VANPO|nr:uncharacterized protein Kpol_541p19 [Vanderwaltozyma polyspora DSM 70294]EDO17776.1 hypothetical protein Kpol_541p19 [Vanderwaltozyma polyspora DSM 70294]